MPVDAPTDWMAVEISLISAFEFSATPNWAQPVDNTPMLLLNMVEKSDTQELMAGQPSAMFPVPP